MGYIRFKTLRGGCVIYYGEDERVPAVKSKRFIKFIGRQGEYNLGDFVKIVKIE